LAKFNALQPGVFALSGWDLCGSLPLPAAQVEHLIAGGDTRWIHRGAYDLMGYENEAFPGMPAATSLYGPLPDQRDDPDSFVSRLKRILEVRDTSGLATASQVDVPPVSHPGMLVMVHDLGSGSLRQVTILNFSQEEIAGSVQSSHLAPGSRLTEMFSGDDLGTVDSLNSFVVDLPPFAGLSVLVHDAGASEASAASASS
ncbi:MAG: maltose alpha-D-glucosyltransferase, partial [Marmoricola sp.]